MNILLDKVPSEYGGYHINTDFRVGIKICNLLQYSGETDEDMLDEIIDLLWGNGVPTTLTDDGVVVDYNLVYETINWFLACGNPKEVKNKQDNQDNDVSNIREDIPYDFDVDAGLIYAAFIQCYNIDLSETDMHWFKFSALFNALNNTVFNRVQEIRTQDPLDYPAGKARSAARRQKEALRIKKVTPQQEANLRAVYGDEWELHI